MALGLAATRLLRAFLYETSPADSAKLAAVCGLLGAVALVAGYVPARRAARTDPLRSLWAE